MLTIKQGNGALYVQNVSVHEFQMDLISGLSDFLGCYKFYSSVSFSDLLLVPNWVSILLFHMRSPTCLPCDLMPFFFFSISLFQ